MSSISQPRQPWIPIIAAVAFSSLAACAGRDAGPAAEEPKSAADLYAEANRHDAEAARQDALAAETAQQPATYPCGDTVIHDQSTSGTERLTPRPCWSVELSPTERHKLQAERLRDQAAEHRHVAKGLLDAERVACEGLAVEDMEHTRCWHRGDVLSVEAELSGARLRGARVLFRQVRGLSVEWMQRALACHQAHAAALGFAPTNMSYCPTTVAGATFEVTQASGGILVIVRATDDDVAALIYSRAEALLARP